MSSVPLVWKTKGKYFKYYRKFSFTDTTLYFFEISRTRFVTENQVLKFLIYIFCGKTAIVFVNNIDLIIRKTQPVSNLRYPHSQDPANQLCICKDQYLSYWSLCVIAANFCVGATCRYYCIQRLKKLLAAAGSRPTIYENKICIFMMPIERVILFNYHSILNKGPP